jgi:hypothetical protein
MRSSSRGKLTCELEDFTAATRIATDALKMYAKDPMFHTETMAALDM